MSPPLKGKIESSSEGMITYSPLNNHYISDIFGNGVKNKFFIKQNEKAWVLRETPNFSEKRARCFKNQSHKHLISSSLQERSEKNRESVHSKKIF
jgi:hypothetical protein